MFNEAKMQVENQLAREIANEKLSWKSVLKALQLLSLSEM